MTQTQLLASLALAAPQMPMPDPDLMILIPFLKFSIAAVVIGVASLPVMRAIARRLDRAPAPRLDGDAEARLIRIEQAVDAVAIEVERIAEAQRFTTKLLSERVAGSIPNGASERPR